MKKLLVSLIAGVLLATGLPLGNVNAAPYCGITWGSLGKTNYSAVNYGTSIINARTGQHDCYDRITFDLNGAAGGYDVRYVPAVYTEGEGGYVPVSGGAILQIVLRAPTYDINYKSTYLKLDAQGKPVPVQPKDKLPRIDLTGYQTFRDARYAGSFEGQSTFGLGVRAQLPFRVVKDGSKIYIDVAHKW